MTLIKTKQAENRREWVEDLRSGMFAQGFEWLRQGQDYDYAEWCCIGVGCDISRVGRWQKVTDVYQKFEAPVWKYVVGGGHLSNEHSQIEFPELVRHHYGLRTATGEFDASELVRLHQESVITLDEFDSITAQRDDAPVNEGVVSLTQLNDFKISFKTIAAIIEFEPKGFLQE